MVSSPGHGLRVPRRSAAALNLSLRNQPPFKSVKPKNMALIRGGLRKKSRKTAGAAPPLSVTVETPKGSRNKLKYDTATGMYKLSKVLPEGMVFPYDFGFVPGTKAPDGDPLDVLVLTDEPLFPGCLVDCTLIGAIEAEQNEDGDVARNDRLIAVAQASLLYSDVKHLADLNPEADSVVLRQLSESQRRRSENSRFPRARDGFRPFCGEVAHKSEKQRWYIAIQAKE
jgi:inorganic pyrophosphatase